MRLKNSVIKMKRYFISIDLEQAGIEAESREEALKEANKLIKEGCYSVEICDEEEI